MDEYIGIIQKTPLFKTMSAEETKKAVEYLKGRVLDYKKGTYIFQRSEKIKNIGLVIKGEARVEREDYYGNRSIIASIGQGDIFGEVYACLENTSLGVNVLAVKDSKILMLNMDKAELEKGFNQEFYAHIIQNLISILAFKAYSLNRKIEHITKRSTREKLLSFFSEQAVLSQSSSFDINFNRQELADYLCVDRSAMSLELSKMSKDGIIAYNKNHFELLKHS